MNASHAISANLYQNVLIVGADGGIGAALEKQLLAQGYQVTGSTRQLNKVTTSRLYLDLEDSATYNNLGSRKFDTAVICAAVTSMQACEDNPTFTRRINIDGTLALAGMLARAGAHLIFLSTNLVFDGSRPHFLSADIKSPLTEYGRQKAEIEDWLISSYPSATIIRFGKVLPPRFQLFAQWQIQLLSGITIKPYATKSIAPISLEIAINLLTWLVAVRKPGIFQASANSEITYAEAAIHLACLCGANPDLVEPTNVPCQGKGVINLIQNQLFNTLEVSPCFADLYGTLSPISALEYSAAR